MSPSRKLVAVTLSFLLAQFATALISSKGYDYCYKDDGICSVWGDFDETCQEETDDAYYECACSSGWVPVYLACLNCQTTFGGIIAPNQDGRWKAMCSDIDESIGPMPSSVVSQQKERNSTVPVPTGTDAIGSTMSYDRSYTTLIHDPITLTLYGAGAATVSLPEIAAPTEAEEDSSTRTRVSGVWAVASCLLVLVVMYQ